MVAHAIASIKLKSNFSTLSVSIKLFKTLLVVKWLKMCLLFFALQNCVHFASFVSTIIVLTHRQLCLKSKQQKNLCNLELEKVVQLFAKLNFSTQNFWLKMVKSWDKSLKVLTPGLKLLLADTWNLFGQWCIKECVNSKGNLSRAHKSVLLAFFHLANKKLRHF